METYVQVWRHVEEMRQQVRILYSQLPKSATPSDGDPEKDQSTQDA